jgi:glycosyltransferase involved in cell wall biosynthesis
MTEAGVLLVPSDDREALAAALARILSDSVFRHVMAERSRLAQINYFSWPAIAARYAEALQGTVHLQ